MQNPSARKASRLSDVEYLLLAHPEGFTQAEIARHLGVNRSTINRYLADLPKQIYIDTDGRWKIDRTGYLIDVRFNLHEALALHLAARLYATRMDRQNPHAAAALRKLSVALERLAPDISNHIRQSADVMDDISQRQDQRYIQVLEALSLAWAERMKVKIWHRTDQDGKGFSYVFAPYFIEAYAVGQSTHVIGLREPPGELRTFKIERIERIEVLRERYTIPSKFDPRELLSDAWGIWYTNHEPEEVVLRFHPHVAARVKETRWHRSEQVAELPNGWLEWRARIAEPKEMLPWIRGWGSDVEVVEPIKLRDAVIQEAIQMMKMYQLNPTDNKTSTSLLRCWGKTQNHGKDSRLFHPAVYHMLDVGYVAMELLGEAASPRWRIALARSFGCKPEEVIGWAPYLVALHDIGKLSDSFQGQNQNQKVRLQQEGLPFGRDNQLHHTVIGQVHTFFDTDDADTPRSMRLILRDAIGGHHGIFHSPSLPKEKQKLMQRDEPSIWAGLRKEAAALLRDFLFQQFPEGWSEPANRSSAVMILTGFTILCDWLGSDETYFSCQQDMDLSVYLRVSQTRAKEAVRQAGFLSTVTSHTGVAFRSLFHHLPEIRPLQAAIDEIPERLLSGPCLAIIEAPTGEGKTEAALALAHKIAKAQGSEELYYALPTTATSDQMFGRVQRYLHDLLGIDARVKLIHGQVFLTEDDLNVEPMENGVTFGNVDSLEWFGPKKRALLAPFGVGTIDQAELAALNTKHNALRLLGLAGKVLLLDEVHAYDTYMTTIIERLLSWLSALGTSVILLSATLPGARRTRLVQAFLGTETNFLGGVDVYPSLVVASHGEIYHANPPATQPQRQLNVTALSFPGEDPQEVDHQKAVWLLEQVKEGGCACWITNTVDRAQRIFEAVDRLAGCEVERMLLHARFPLNERHDIENALAERYGPTGEVGGNRPLRAIVIGTQVLEQSLDLDFDVMMTDLAPVDLLLQRAGRLHRHTRSRPVSHEQPRLYINLSVDKDGALQLREDQYIYPAYILRKTWLAISESSQLHLPEDYRRLVELVYTNDPPEAGSSLEKEWKELQMRQEKEAVEAITRLIPLPDPLESFCGKIANLTFEEDENKAGWRIAQTRLGEPSLTVIPLERSGSVVSCPGVEELFDLDERLPRRIQLALMRRSLRISNQPVLQAILQQNLVLPGMFNESELLKGSYPLWLENGCVDLNTSRGIFSLTLNPRLGLVIRKS